MLTHIVAWKFLDEADHAGKAENLQKAKRLLEALPATIREIRSMEVGIDVTHTGQSYDLVLVSRFASAADLRAYQQHPDHVNVVPFLRKVQVTKVVVDYEG